MDGKEASLKAKKITSSTKKGKKKYLEPLDVDLMRQEKGNKEYILLSYYAARKKNKTKKWRPMEPTRIKEI